MISLSLIQILFLGSVGLLLVGGLLSFIAQNNPRLSMGIAFTGVSLASLLGIIFGLMVLLSGNTLELNLPWSIVGLQLKFEADSLSALFVFLISLISLPVSVYSYGYVGKYIGQRNVGVMGLLYSLFIFSMLGLVCSGNALLFLFFWELMSLASYFLVVFEHNDGTVRNAGFIYIVMTHIGTLGITLAFFLLYHVAGSFTFASYISAGSHLSEEWKNVIFLLISLGFGTKAGLVPLHIWLPKAHPAAPSNVSALMSAVMLKMAIFGFVKITFQVLGGGPLWWGVLTLIVGMASALLGIIYALMERDVKRLLAFSSIENMGIILMGLGVAMILRSSGQNQLAFLGLIAALTHTFNHGIFKGLLFMGAGSIQFSLHTLNMEKMGGLLKKMPWTGFFFLIGAVSISALPPFNGFISEWLTFQALILLGSGMHNSFWNILGPLSGAVLALTGALAATTFVQAFGIQFLALPRSTKAEQAMEVPVTMRIAMGFLAVFCLGLGLVPVLVFRLINPVTEVLLGMKSSFPMNGFKWIDVMFVNGPSATIAPLNFLLLFGGMVVIVYSLTRLIGSGGRIRIAETWNCGMNLSPKMEYSATSFSKPLRIIFRRIVQSRSEVQKEYKLAPYFLKSIKYEGAIKPVFEDALYKPITRLFIGLNKRIRILQSGSIQLYLTYIFITLVVLLMFAR